MRHANSYSLCISASCCRIHKGEEWFTQEDHHHPQTENVSWGNSLISGGGYLSCLKLQGRKIPLFRVEAPFCFCCYLGVTYGLQRCAKMTTFHEIHDGALRWISLATLELFPWASVGFQVTVTKDISIRLVRQEKQPTFLLKVLLVWSLMVPSILVFSPQFHFQVVFPRIPVLGLQDTQLHGWEHQAAAVPGCNSQPASAGVPSAAAALQGYPLSLWPGLRFWKIQLMFIKRTGYPKREHLHIKQEDQFLFVVAGSEATNKLCTH